MTSTNQHLTHLAGSGLVRLAQRVPELEYLFRHALVQDAAYRSLLRQDRKRLHLTVGETLERMYPDRLEDLAPLLGHHFALAGDDPRALRYFTLAGDTDASVYANTEAAGHYTQALEIARRSEVSGEELTSLFTRLGRALELNSRFDEALVNYREMEALANQRGDRSMALTGLIARITLHTTPTPAHDPAQGEALAQQALLQARELGDRAAESRILWNLGLVRVFTGRAPEAVPYGEGAVALARELDLRELTASTLNDLSMFYMLSTHLDQAKASLNEVITLWRELGNLPMLTDSLSMACNAYTHSGEYDQAMAASEEAHQISQSAGNLWGQSNSRLTVGRAYWERGQPGRAMAVAEDSIRLSASSGFVVPQVMTRADLAAVYGSLGAIERGLNTAQLAVTTSESHFPAFRVYALGVLAHLHLLNGDLAEAALVVERGKADPGRHGCPLFFRFVTLAEVELALRQGDFEQALALGDAMLTDLRETNTRAHVPTVLHFQAQALMGLGQNETARERLLEARAAAEAIGSRRSLWQILSTLGQLETDPAEAERLRQQARQVIEYIADHIDTPDLQTLFLNLPDVRAVLDSER